jgi:hypothetical protein
LEFVAIDECKGLVMRCFSALLAVITALLLCPQNVSACFCGSPDLTKAIRNANAIFSGKVVEVSPERVVFDVHEVWKGKVSSSLVLSQRGGSCDLTFEVGKTYLIYARKYRNMLSEDDRWSTDECSGSKNMSKADKDLKRLWVLKLNRSQRQVISQE